jgi:hypothetical protein
MSQVLGLVLDVLTGDQEICRWLVLEVLWAAVGFSVTSLVNAKKQAPSSFARMRCQEKGCFARCCFQVGQNIEHIAIIVLG